MLNNNVQDLVEKLNLLPHPEGGFFKEVYRSKDIVEPKSKIYSTAEKGASTSIYFLLTKGNFSAWHRLKSDELWHFYSGSPLIIYSIDEYAKLEKTILGNPIEVKDAQFQLCVKANTWFASEVLDEKENSFSLAGCTVSPAFDFTDFELGNRKALTYQFSQHKDIIEKLTRIEENDFINEQSTLTEPQSEANIFKK